MTTQYEVKPSKFNVVLNVSTAIFFALMYLALVIACIIGKSYWGIPFGLLFFGFFVGGNVFLHFNYWKFDSDTILCISEDEFVLKNKKTGKELTLKTSDISESISVYSTGRLWDYSYTRFKLVDGRWFTLSDYLIDSSDLWMESLKRIMKEREIRRPRSLQ
jgi:hypothetical protein